MKCLIIAAGEGSRLQQKGESKPLVPILGVPLIERVIRTALEAGVDEFHVVVGYRGDRVREFLMELAARIAVPIKTLVNDDWDNGNGLSVLKAQGVLSEPFLLLMADHLFAPHLVTELTALSLSPGEIALAVDTDTTNALVDMADVTRVKVEAGKILDIGKEITDFSGFDTGAFMCTAALFAALEQSRRAGDATLSGAVRILASEGNAKAIDTHEFWIDVDDPAAHARAEQALLDRLRDKPNDGPVARYLNRPVSIRLSRYLSRLDVTPNEISVVSFLGSVIAAGLFAFGGYFALALGGVLAQFASILDGCDGEVARLKFQSSDFGGWFDAVLDRYADAFLLFGLSWHVAAEQGGSWIAVVGFMAIVGSFMLSYTADKYDNLMRQRIEAGGQAGLRMGRDVRVFLIFLGAVTHLIFPVLLLIAVVMNLEVVRRVKVAHD